MNANPLSAGRPTYDFYSIEVVQRIGYDSFTPDNGVLLAKNRTEEERNNSCGQNYNCFTWVIDAHPEDINRVDYRKPNGDRVMRTIADYRQLNDALFHAGLNSGSEYEWTDAHNRLHFYVVDVERDARGILSYVIGVRSLDGAGPHQRGVQLTAPRSITREGAFRVCTFTLRNTGSAGTIPSDAHPRETGNATSYDIYRLSVMSAGGTAQLRNALAAISFGGSQEIPVYVAGNGSATLRAVSESDATRSATASCAVH